MLKEMKKEPENLAKIKDPKEFEKFIFQLANKIHPDATKLAMLVSALKSIKDVCEVIELSESSAERLRLLKIELYSLIKVIHKEKNVPEEIISAMKEILSQPSKLF